MKEIKMKESCRMPKVRNPAGKMPKEQAKMTALEAKEKSHRIADNVRAGEEQESPTEYASAKVETAEEWADEAGSESRSACFFQPVSENSSPDCEYEIPRSFLEADPGRNGSGTEVAEAPCRNSGKADGGQLCKSSTGRSEAGSTLWKQGGADDCKRNLGGGKGGGIRSEVFAGASGRRYRDCRILCDYDRSHWRDPL